MIHELKLEISYFDAAQRGDKPFEIRYNDRDYQKGDLVLMKAWWPAGQGNCYCSERPDLRGVITHVTTYEQKDGWCVFGIRYEPPQAQEE